MSDLGFGSVIAHLPGCFCFHDFGFDMEPLDSFMLNLCYYLRYSIGQFQVLQQIVLVMSGASCRLDHFLEIHQHLV